MTWEKMTWENKPNGPVATAQGIEDVLRHPDGSFDIGAYRKIAHRERAAAIESSMREMTRIVRSILSAIRARLTQLGKSEPVCGKHHAQTGR